MALPLLLALLLGGCADVASLAQSMNDRGIAACHFYSGGYGLFIGVHGIIATGGTTLDECQALR